MTERYLKQSTLAHLELEARARVAPAAAGVRMGEARFRGQIALRGDAGSETFVDAVKEVFGVDVPVKPNTASMPDGARYLLWLGPDEWLAVVPDGTEEEIVTAFKQRMEGEHFAVTDVSGSRTVISLSGDCARELLMKGTSLDLHPNVFGPDQCAQASMARCHMLLHQTSDAPAYDIYVHRSFADYLWRWLEDAAREYGVVVMSSS
ncbi:MAG TPA: sarcosine oxidase subunit gamma family protein [Gammaproteobacteria bacterium]|nr:sarcosine oxidase subunit gamma family protein [Gammaproteobacteria bacterium]